MHNKNNADKELRVAIGKRVRAIRNRFGLSAERVAEKLRMSRQNLTHIETGRHHVNATTLWKLACLFECSPSEFLPDIAKGFGLNKSDLRKVAKEEPNAVEWAKELFGEKI